MHSLDQLRTRHERTCIDEPTQIKISLNPRVTPINGNAPGRLGVKQLLRRVARRRVIFIGETELVVLEELMLLELSTTTSQTSKDVLPNVVEQATGRIHLLVP